MICLKGTPFKCTKCSGKRNTSHITITIVSVIDPKIDKEMDMYLLDSKKLIDKVTQLNFLSLL